MVGARFFRQRVLRDMAGNAFAAYVAASFLTVLAVIKVCAEVEDFLGASRIGVSKTL